MAIILRTFLPLLLLAGPAAADEPARSWTCATEGALCMETAIRFVLLPGDRIERQVLFAGVRQSRTYAATVGPKHIEYTDEAGGVVRLDRRGDDLVVRLPGSRKKVVFHRSPEWDEKFERAPPVPATEREAIVAMRAILKPEDLDRIRATKREDLVELHFGLAMWVRNAFELWSADSPLRGDLGGGHPDDASMKLVEAFWAELQQDAP